MSTFTRLVSVACKRTVLKNGRNASNRVRNLYLLKNGGALNQVRFQHTDAEKTEDYHSIIKNTEKPLGESTKHEFQAETRMLLDIVARSLYSEKEVFIRELISNASDALEKFRYISMSESEGDKINRPLEIHISTDKNARIFTIQDTGIGMTRDELVQNLGIIAKSGSKAFIEQIKQQQTGAENIIGQFGVGFYSAFMVADKVEVYTRSSLDDHGWKWTSDGTGSYEIQPAEGVSFGTKIVLHLKGDSREFADDETIKNIITKYSNFVGSPIYLNGKKANIVQPLWLKDPKSVTKQEHMEFYKFISGSYDLPRYTLHYKTDVPLSIAALLYFPEGKPGLFEMSRETESGVALYTKKVLIKNRTDNILPKWLRFVKGVVDSEDIPLNLSRELLQNSNLIRKLRDVLTGRVTKFLLDQLKKDQGEYEKFYQDYGIFIKEGIITNHNQTEKEDAAKLLLFESSRLEAGKKITLTDYIKGATESRTILYLAAPSRTLAESSPYFESLKNKPQEVLFCYEPYDELVLMQLQQFQGYRLISVEKDMRDDKAASDLTNLGEDSLKRSEINELSNWLKEKLVGKVASVNATTRLENHPCVVTVEEMAAARHFIRTQSHGLPEDRRYAILQPQLEINPKHPIIKKLYKLRSGDPELAELLANQNPTLKENFPYSQQFSRKLGKTVSQFSV
ncbi:heat shock protein 75 kDa, mitochondrial isoform X2 [Anthonomus grandis grandis]|uniref:heat shock protein 75 kDa, mitochondrial isoform X2 n=1 Tax=Anthonomus grandis grandis TaxID=2921223 RepID=UPI0021669484|nr:heat shock protein 75 kDa, mitochondrial isoform X2 [Anthonomus grandis grandis]